MVDFNSFANDPKTFLGKRAITVQGNRLLSAATLNQKSLAFHGGETVTVVELDANKTVIDVELADEHGKLVINVFNDNKGKIPCYYLPWRSGHAYMVQLGAKADFFTTAYMSSCGLLISGASDRPVVIHANCGNSDRIANAAAKPAEIDQYSVLYSNLAGQLISDGTLPAAGKASKLAIFDPAFYMAGKNAGYASVFGVRKSGQWQFFYNIGNKTNGITGRLWPEPDLDVLKS
jgi:hypothetical protein